MNGRVHPWLVATYQRHHALGPVLVWGFIGLAAVGGGVLGLVTAVEVEGWLQGRAAR